MSATGPRYRAYDQDSVPLNPSSPFFFEHVSRYWWAATLAAGKDVLDCACGKGYGTYIMSRDARSALGIDLNKASLSIAKERFRRANLEYLEQNVLELGKLGRKFDVITAFEIIEHIPPETTGRFLDALGGALAPGGILLVSTPNHDVVLKSGVAVPEFHINNFKATELRRALGERFEKVEMLGQYPRKRGLLSLLFHFDYLNLRHVIGRRLRRASALPAAQAASAQPVADVEAAYFDHKPTEADTFMFSPYHWRQAGLNVAVCSRPRRRP